MSNVCLTATLSLEGNVSIHITSQRQIYLMAEMGHRIVNESMK